LRIQCGQSAIALTGSVLQRRAHLAHPYL
jgi:hypothetical protein